MNKRVKVFPALMVPVLLSAAILFYGFYASSSAAKRFSEEQERMPETAMMRLLDQLEAGEYAEVFTDTLAYQYTPDSAASYSIFLDRMLEECGREELSFRKNGDAWRIYAGDVCLADAYVYQDAEGMPHAALPLQGQRTAWIEVPAGSELIINGRTQEKPVEENVPASECFAFPSNVQKAYVDVYRVDDLLGDPAADEYALIKDVLSGRYLAGKKVTDPELLEEMVRAAELLAAYPAQDASLGQVQAVSLTNTSWYARYATLQNYWFTAHSVSEFSNEQVLEAVYRNEDTVSAHIVFDYFADNGEVHRTWHCGYQLTFLRTDNGWKIAAVAINNALNAAAVVPQ